jgi:hypothetical protein
MSHIRSCTVAIAEKYRVSRESVITLVSQLCGVDLMTLQEPEAITRAIALLDRMKREGVTIRAEPDAPPNSRSPSQLPTSPEDQTPDSLRLPSSGGCG